MYRGPYGPQMLLELKLRIHRNFKHVFRMHSDALTEPQIIHCEILASILQ